MFPSRSSSRVLWAAAVALTGTAACAQGPVGSSFTYQGKLELSGAPASGTYDLQFRLFDAATAGHQLGATECFDNVQVAGGLLTLPLDFGALFGGQACWLQVEVRADTTLGNCGLGSFTVLAPRQALRPTPYSSGVALPLVEGTSTLGAALYISNDAGDALSGISGAAGRSGVYGVGSDTGGYGVFGRNTASGNFGYFGSSAYGVAASTANANSICAYFENTAGGTALYSAGPARVYTTNTATDGLFAQTAAGGGVIGGVHGVATGANGNGVYGEANNGAGAWGVWGSSSSGVGVAGLGTSTASAGVYGSAPGPSGSNTGLVVSGVLGESSTGYGVAGYSAAPGPAGVYGATNNSISTGVYGINLFSSNAGALGQIDVGVRGLCTSGVAGVFGQAEASTGFTAGVYGLSNSPGGVGAFAAVTANTGTPIAVWGSSIYPTGYAGYFQGRAYFSDSVGIGILQPTVPLQVVGGSDASLNGGGNIVVGQIGNANIVIDNNEIMARNDGAAANLFLNALGGSVGIGTNNPQGFLLAVNGSAAKPGGGTWSSLSDARLKKNIRPLAGSLDKLLALRGVSFEFIDPAGIHELPGERIGMLAQEIEAVVPDWVDTGPDGFKRVTYRGFEALTVEALRDLREQKDHDVSSLRHDVETLRAEGTAKDEQIADLKQRVARLEELLRAKLGDHP